jgi:alpha-L-fucosidase 2
LKNGTLDNLWDTHPPFQIDGNFGGTAGVTEMLMQSHMGFIHLLPALPDAWKDGEVKGLCAKGNFEVSIRWQNGELKEVEILSKNGGACELRYKDKVKALKTSKGKNYKLTF